MKKIDDRQDYGEERTFALGNIDGVIILAVVYIDENETIRLISARKGHPSYQHKSSLQSFGENHFKQGILSESVKYV